MSPASAAMLSTAKSVCSGTLLKSSASPSGCVAIHSSKGGKEAGDAAEAAPAVGGVGEVDLALDPAVAAGGGAPEELGGQVAVQPERPAPPRER